MASPKSLALMEFSDRELLNVMLDVEDENGYVTTEQLMETIGLDHKHARSCVGIRLSWMRRYGVVDRHEKKGWTLTPIGRRIALGALTDEEKKVLRDLTSEQLMEATRVLTGRYQRVGATASTMMRRAWQNGTGRRT